MIPNKRDRVRTDDRQRRPAWRIGDDHACSAARCKHAFGHVARNQVHTDEIGHVTRTRTCGHFGERADLHDATRIENGDTIGQRIRIDRIMGDKDRHPLERLEVPTEIAAHDCARAHVERCERFVEQEHARRGRQCAHEGNTLCLAAGQRLGTSSR